LDIFVHPAMIPEQTVEQIMNAAVIEEVVGDYVELKKSGSSLRGLSPFTNEKTPSFYVLPAKGIFKCFSSGKGRKPGHLSHGVGEGQLSRSASDVGQTLQH
jgi:hypothetical protein